MKKILEVIRRLFVLGMGFLVFVGLPMFIGGFMHMWWSWIPALIVMDYLDI